MRGEIKPGGLPKRATIFFSDIRGFTEKSENFTKAFGREAPDRIVQWLNDYFTRMVECVEKTGGVVDKFIGDAIMAHWGTASTSERQKRRPELRCQRPHDAGGIIQDEQNPRRRGSGEPANPHRLRH